MTKQNKKATRQKKKIKTELLKDQEPYIEFEPMGEMEIIPAKNRRKDFQLRKP